MCFFLFISVYTELQIFGLEMDGAFSDGGGGINCRRQTTLQQGGLWYMVHNIMMTRYSNIRRCSMEFLNPCQFSFIYPKGFILARISSPVFFARQFLEVKLFICLTIPC